MITGNGVQKSEGDRGPDVLFMGDAGVLKYRGEKEAQVVSSKLCVVNAAFSK